VRFRSLSDTEVILKLYAKRGIAALDRLRGMFAFALWDNAEETLLLAVDPLGVKPLYYARGPDGSFLFASEIRAILANGLVPLQLDPVALEGYLAYGAVQAPNTIVRGVTCMLGGTYVLAHADGAVSEPVRYWSPPFASASAPAAEIDVVIPQLQDLLLMVVRDHLVSDVPVGAFLSGGIDSSSIVALMHRIVPGAVHTFSV